MARAALAACLGLLAAHSACAPSESKSQKSQNSAPSDIKLILAAYSAPREVFEQAIIPAFREHYQAQTGKSISVEASYLASGAQARAVISGFEADMAVLALEGDIDKMASAGLLSPKWREKPGGPFVTASLVAMAVRPGNPKQIQSYGDLARPGIEVLLPNPKTSGAAMWNGNALYGAALLGYAGTPQNDKNAAEAFLKSVLNNVLILDKGARESMITFEKGIADVAVTYESEIAAGRLAGRKYDTLIPPAALLVEIPGTIIDQIAQKHGVIEPAERFIAFLHSDTAQQAFIRYGFRSLLKNPEKPGQITLNPPLPPGTRLFRVEDIGGWQSLTPALYGSGGLFERMWEAKP